MGTYRWIRAWSAGLVGFSVATVVLFVVMLDTASAARPSGSLFMFLAFGPVVVMCAAISAALAVAIAIRSGPWSLSADDAGLRIVRGLRRPRDMPWDRVARIRYGPVAVPVTRYRVELAEGLYVDLRGRGTVRLDTARFRVSTEDLDRMIAVAREGAARHGVSAEPFPMAGRERP